MGKHFKRLTAVLLATMLLLSTMTNIAGLYADGKDPVSRIYNAISGSEAHTAEEYSARAEEKIAQSDYRGALEDLQSARELSDAQDEICTLWLRTASISVILSDDAQARSATDAALEADPASSQAWLLSAQLYLAEGDSKAAAEALERYTTLAPADTDTRAQLAQIYEDMERYGDAADTYEALYQSVPGEDGYLINALRCRFLSGDYEETQTGFGSYLDDQTKVGSEFYPVAAFLYAACAMQLGNYAEAAQRYRVAMDAGYDASGCYEQMLYCSFEAGEYARVVEIAEAMTQSGVQSADAASFHQMTGVALLQLDRAAQAVDELTLAIDLSGSHYYRGAALLALERYDEAAEDFTKSIEENYLTDYALYNRGVCRVKTGAYESAMDDFDAVLAGDNESLIESATDALMQIAGHSIR